MAGTGDDHLSALNLKAEWETLLGLPISAPYDSVYEAGSHESQDAVYGMPKRAEAKVWVDTVRPALLIEPLLKTQVLPYHEHSRLAQSLNPAA